MTDALGDGDTLGDYRIDRLLGRGGMGVVYLAAHVELGRRAAIKVIAPHLADDPTFTERFRRESRLAATLDHPNVVPVYEAGERDDRLYIAMRFVDGTDLRSLLAAEGRLDPDRAVGIVRQIAAALDAAHAQSLVHRDVKPSNVLLLRDPPDHVYLTDFGISTHGTATATTMTIGGGVAGSADYVAPEQILGELVDGRADIYSLGCLAFETVVGRPPFRRDTDAATLGAHLHAPPPKASEANPKLSPRVDAPIARALAKRPEDRWPTAGAFAAALAEAGHPIAAGVLPSAVRGRGARRVPLDRRAVIGTLAASAVLATGAFAATSHVSRGPPGVAHAGRRMFADAFWGVRFRYPRGWTLRSMRAPGIGGVGSGDVFCNLFDEARARPARNDDELLDLGRHRARQLHHGTSGGLRSIELVHDGAVAGVEIVADAGGATRPSRLARPSSSGPAARCVWSASPRRQRSPRTTAPSSSPC